MPRRSPLGTAELEARMRPGAWSVVGFLGREERLEDVLTADAGTLAELGLTSRRLADPLDYLMRAHDVLEGPFDTVFPGYRAERIRLRREIERRFGFVEELDTGTVRVARRFEVDVVVYAGLQECPWSGESCRSGSFDWTIRNLANGVELSGPELITHLIGAHGFFEGFESPYRVDPRALAELLELA